MAYCDQRQIDKAYAAYMSGFQPNEVRDRRTPSFKQGWNSGYTMGEDHGFGRGWEAAMSYRRTRDTRWRMLQRPGYRKLVLRRAQPLIDARLKELREQPS